MERLFVYGSLIPGGPNEHVLSDIGGHWTKASVKGHLHDAGWGSHMGYPAIVLDETAEAVNGFVFSSVQLKDHWSRLDVFEGKEYTRVATHVWLADGSTVEAFVYVLHDRLQGPRTT